MLTHLNFDGMNRRARKRILLHVSRAARLHNCGWSGFPESRIQSTAYAACDIAKHEKSESRRRRRLRDLSFKEFFRTVKKWGEEDRARAKAYAK